MQNKLGEPVVVVSQRGEITWRRQKDPQLIVRERRGRAVGAIRRVREEDLHSFIGPMLKEWCQSSLSTFENYSSPPGRYPQRFVVIDHEVPGLQGVPDQRSVWRLPLHGHDKERRREGDDEDDPVSLKTHNLFLPAEAARRIVAARDVLSQFVCR